MKYIMMSSKIGNNIYRSIFTEMERCAEEISTKEIFKKP